MSASPRSRFLSGRPSFMNPPRLQLPPRGRVAVDLTCASGYSSPVPARTAAPSAAGSCWSTGRGPWRWWPSGWSPAPARTRWNSGWRKYCALPAMGNKEINKKAKAPLMRRSGQLGYNRVLRPRNHLGGPSIVTSAQWTHHIFFIGWKRIGCQHTKCFNDVRDTLYLTARCHGWVFFQDEPSDLHILSSPQCGFFYFSISCLVFVIFSTRDVNN